MTSDPSRAGYRSRASIIYECAAEPEAFRMSTLAPSAIRDHPELAGYGPPVPHTDVRGHGDQA